MFKTEKRATMQSIADELNISKNAVSIALNDRPGVSEETRSKVIAMAKKVGYGSFKKNIEDNKNILVYIPEYIQNDAFFYNDIYWSIDYYASKKGYNAVMATITKEMQDNLLMPNICDEMAFTGALIIGVLQNNYVKFIANQGMAILSIDNTYYGLGIESIITANLEGSYLITEKVIEMGHKDIGFVGALEMTSSIFERWCGFQKALIDNHIELNNDFVITDDSPLKSLLSNFDEIIERLIHLKKMPTVFVCAGDRTAIAVIQSLKEMRYKVPEDISVVGFDDIELAHYIEPPLTTMHVKRKEMGKCSIDTLLRLINGKVANGQFQLGTYYVERKSLTKVKEK